MRKDTPRRGAVQPRKRSGTNASTGRKPRSGRAQPEPQADQALRECRESLERERTARQEADEACKVKEEFLSVLSHELRGPLNAILGWAHLLRDGRLDRETAARGLEIICKNAELQGRIITDIVDASRQAGGSLQAGETVDVAALLKRAVETSARRQGTE